MALIIVFIISECNSQWVQSSAGMGNDKNVHSIVSSGNNIFAATSTSGVWLSTNNGLNWNQTSLNNRTVKSLAVSGNNVFAGTDMYGIYRSTNNGINWNQTSINSNWITSLVIIGNNIYAGDEFYGVWRSTNNGVSWTVIGLNNIEVLSLANSGNLIFTGTLYGVYLSTNNGQNWTQSSLNSRWIVSLFASGSNVYAGCSNDYGVWLSTNYGANWLQSGLNDKYILSFVTSGTNVLAGIYQNGVWFSNNNCASWISKNEGFSTTPSVRSLHIVNNYIFAGTYSNSLWRRPLQDIIGIEEISSETPNKFELLQNYPNPFNPTTRFGFRIADFGLVRFTIFDAVGREVQVLVNQELSSGTYEIDFDGSALPSGVYFYKLQANSPGSDFEDAGKMVLIK